MRILKNEEMKGKLYKEMKKWKENYIKKWRTANKKNERKTVRIKEWANENEWIKRILNKWMN